MSKVTRKALAAAFSLTTAAALSLSLHLPANAEEDITATPNPPVAGQSMTVSAPGCSPSKYAKVKLAAYHGYTEMEDGAQIAAKTVAAGGSMTFKVPRTVGVAVTATCVRADGTKKDLEMKIFDVKKAKSTKPTSPKLPNTGN